MNSLLSKKTRESKKTPLSHDRSKLPSRMESLGKHCHVVNMAIPALQNSRTLFKVCNNHQKYYTPSMNIKGKGVISHCRQLSSLRGSLIVVVRSHGRRWVMGDGTLHSFAIRFAWETPQPMTSIESSLLPSKLLHKPPFLPFLPIQFNTSTSTSISTNKLQLKYHLPLIQSNNPILGNQEQDVVPHTHHSSPAHRSRQTRSESFQHLDGAQEDCA
jgi:hypothetical protein